MTLPLFHIHHSFYRHSTVCHVYLLYSSLIGYLYLWTLFYLPQLLSTPLYLTWGETFTYHGHYSYLLCMCSTLYINRYYKYSCHPNHCVWSEYLVYSQAFFIEAVLIWKDLLGIVDGTTIHLQTCQDVSLQAETCPCWDYSLYLPLSAYSCLRPWPPHYLE